MIMVRASAWFILALTLAGCAAEVDDAEVIEVPRRTMNSLGENRVTLHAATLARIVAAPLAPSTDTKRLASSTSGAQLVDYLARCALGKGDTVALTRTLTVPRAPSLGLAPAWTWRGLEPAEQRWVMACLLAHINATGKSVAISARGDHPALALDAAEAADFPLREGAFWGAFSSPDPDRPGVKQYACYSDELADVCGASQAAALLWDRLCAHGGCADLYIVGPCSDKDPSTAVACEVDAGGAFTGCGTTAAPLGQRTKGEAIYAEVVTTYLADAPACD